MTNAADVLHVTQPTLSRQIADLEKELGCELFLRRGRQMELTEKGEYLRRRASEIVELADQTEADMKATEGELEGVIRIAAGESWVIGPLGSVMRGFMEAHPKVKFSIHSGNGEDVAWRLSQGLADFAVFMAKSELSKYSTLRFAGTDAWGLLMPRDHELSKKETISPEDLKGIPLMISEGSIERGSLKNWLGKSASKLNIVCTYTLAFNAAKLVEEHLGCALIFDKIIPAGAGTNLEFRLLYPPVVSHADLAWRDTATLPPAARAFIEAIRQSNITVD